MPNCRPCLVLEIRNEKKNPLRNNLHPRLQLVANYPPPVYDNTNIPADDVA